MPISARVKETGELFEAINEKRMKSSVNALEPRKVYEGFLYAGQFDSAKTKDGYTMFRFTDRAAASFSADKLEPISLPLRIKRRKKKTQVAANEKLDAHITTIQADPELGTIVKKGDQVPTIMPVRTI